MPHGIDPVLDEVALLRTLREGALTPDQFSHIMNMILIACYDRKVERGFMCNMVHRVSEMHRVLAAIDEAVCIELGRRAALPAPKLAKGKKVAPVGAITSEMITSATQTFKMLRGQLAEQFQLVTNCALASDNIS